MSEQPNLKDRATPSLFVLTLGVSRLAELMDAAEHKGWAGEVVKGFSTQGTGRLYAALISDRVGKLTHVCRLVRRRVAAENRQSVSLLEFEALNRKDAQLLATAIKASRYNRNDVLLKNLGRLTPSENKKAFGKIERDNPQLAEVLRKKAKADDRILSGLSENERTIIGFQRDAVGVALGIAFNNDRDDLLVPARKGKPDAYLTLLETKGLTEDEVIFHDKKRFPDLKILSDANPRFTTFAHNGSILKVIHANRNDLEHTLGVDLIYVSEYFNSFIGVQYKMMNGSGNDTTFYADKGFTKQINLMNDIYDRLQEKAIKFSQIGHRLNSMPFYFKFVSRLETNFADDALCPGMYLPTDFISKLRSCVPSEKIGGKHKTRHLSNTDFSVLVRQGWIGAEPERAMILEELILEGLKKKRSLTLAVESRAA